MRGTRAAAAMALAGALLFTALLSAGCAPLLERTYTTVEPHSSRFWDSGSGDILRAENYQDVVNDLLLLIGQHTESATLRLYGFQEDLSASELLERAGAEIQQETPLGAYAVEYLTSSVQSQRGCDEAAVRISYRRTAEQIQSIVNATSPQAVYSLLESALEEGREELAVRISYWGAEGQQQVEDTVLLLRRERELESPWLVTFYPAGQEAGLVEFLLSPAPEVLDQPLGEGSFLFEGLPPEEEEEPPEASESSENPENPDPPDTSEGIEPSGAAEEAGADGQAAEELEMRN